MRTKLLSSRLRANSTPTRAIWNVFLPIALGAAIYTLWRSHRLLVFDWYERFGLTPTVFALRHAAGPLKSKIPSVLLYSLPDALWVYAFTAALVLIWRTHGESRQRSVWLLIPSVIALGAEFGQAFHLVPGTFDWLDVVSYIIAGALGAYLPPVTLVQKYRISAKEIHAIV